MEAEDGYKMEAEGGYQPPKAVAWKGDWDLYKRQFRAAARLNGMENAIKLAEKLAKGQDFAVLLKQEEEETRQALAQSSRLQARLVLSLIGTMGPQQALLGSGEKTGLEQHVPGLEQIGADVEANPVMVEEATARVRRVATMSAKWNRLALCGLVERLAAGIAYFTIMGTLPFVISAVVGGRRKSPVFSILIRAPRHFCFYLIIVFSFPKITRKHPAHRTHTHSIIPSACFYSNIL